MLPDGGRWPPVNVGHKKARTGRAITIVKRFLAV